MVRQSSRALSYTVSCGLALTALLASSQIAPAVQISPVLASATDPRPDPASAQMHLERARALSLLGDFDAAQNEFAHAAKLQREIGVLPTEALWSIAEIYYGKGRDIQAAEVLVDLFGDKVVQLRLYIFGPYRPHRLFLGHLVFPEGQFNHHLFAVQRRHVCIPIVSHQLV